MRRDSRSPPPGVAERLAALRAAFRPERDEDARARLARERPPSRESFDVAAARRLRELRALDELTRHLHRRSR